MKWILMALSGLALVTSVSLGWKALERSNASGCVSLIREARGELEDVTDPTLQSQLRKLIDEANLQAKGGRGRACMRSVTKAFHLIPGKS